MKCLIVGCGYVGLPLGAELDSARTRGLWPAPECVGGNRIESGGHQTALRRHHPAGNLAKLPREFDWVVNCVASRAASAEDYRQVYLQGTRNLIEWLARQAAEEICLYQQHERLWPDRRFTGQGIQPHRTRWRKRRRFSWKRKKCCWPRWLNASSRRCILRVAGIYGPDRGHWFKQFLKNEARIEGDGSRFLNMIHRDDLIGCIIAALKSGRPGEIYNAVDDEPVSQVNFFQWLAAAVGKYPPPSVPENPDENRKRGVTNKRVLNRRLKMELGYQFKYPNFRKGYSAELLRLERAGELHVMPGER